MDTLSLTNVNTNLYVNGLNAIPTGSIMCFAGATSPSGWLLCDGSAVSRTTYASLFTSIGTTYGIGNGTTTFNLPNLQDRFPMGKGNNSLGNTGGSNSVTLTTSQLPSHSHTATVSSNGSHNHTGTTDSSGNHTHTYTDAYFAENISANSGILGSNASDYDNSYQYRSNPVTDSAGVHSHTFTTNTIDDHTHTVIVAPTGDGSSINITNKYITLNYIIRY